MQWTRVTDESVDVFADLRPADAVCDDAGYVYDPYYQAIEIYTEVCDYLTLQQPTLVDLEPGDMVSVLGYHDVLSAPDPAQGYLGLAIAGELEWELSVPIPSDAEDLRGALHRSTESSPRGPTCSSTFTTMGRTPGSWSPCS